MRMNFRPLLSHSTALLAGIILAGLGTAVYAWTGPQNSPPACVAGQAGCDAPINVGTGSQVKNGNLSVNTFTATQNSLFYGNLGVGSSNAPSYPLDVTGTVRASGEVISTNANQFRMVQGNYGAFFRNDGANTYFLLTALGDQYGSWNTLRPLIINDASGAVSVNTNLTVNDTGGTTHAIVGNGPSTGSSYYGVVGQSGSYYGALGRADGYSFVGSGQLYNAGLIHSTSGGVMFPDGTTQTTAASGGADPGTLCGMASGSNFNICNGACSNYSSIATCKGQSVVSSCPAGYTLVSWVSGTGGTCQSGLSVGHYYMCSQTCVKN